MPLLKMINKYLDLQYGKPVGVIGTYIGEKMVRQHKTETLWTIDLLELDEDEKVLELGCGAGYAMKILLRDASIKALTGLDISDTVLKSARVRNRNDLGKGRAKLLQGDVRMLPLGDNLYTKAFSIQSIYFWKDINLSIEEIHRVLLPGGRLVLTLSNGKAGVMWESINYIVENQFIPAMKQHGFQNIELREGPDSRQYHTIAILGEKI